jgi:peptidyl-prolyl cis-trans isomerase C
MGRIDKSRKSRTQTMNIISASSRFTGGCLLLCASIALVTLSGCGKASAPGSTQVVARVNDKEITISQLNETLQSTTTGPVTPEVTRQAITKLVNEELLVQDALKDKLDRDPHTVQAFEHARRQILAQLYAQRMLFPRTPVALSEEEAYYKANPGLFERRRLYHLTVFTIQSADLNESLGHELDNAHSSEGVRDILEKREIRFETQQLNSTAEELPMDKLAQFTRADPGDLLEAREKNGTILLVSVGAVEDKPLSFERAKPIIERYLTNTRNNQAIEDHLKRAKATTKISYMGRFATLGSQTAAIGSAGGAGDLAGADHRPASLN